MIQHILLNTKQKVLSLRTHHKLWSINRPWNNDSLFLLQFSKLNLGGQNDRFKQS